MRFINHDNRMIRANIDPSMIHNPGSSGCFMLQFPKYRVCCVDVKKKKID